MILSGGSSSWTKLHQGAVGTITRGLFVGFTAGVPSKVAAYGPQDILVLNIDGADTSIPCPAGLGRVFKNNNVAVGTPLAITYKGKTAKGGKSFHEFTVEAEEGDTSFPPKNDAPKNDADEEAALAAKIAALKAKKKAA
jgi:hypothetical protein